MAKNNTRFPTDRLLPTFEDLPEEKIEEFIKKFNEGIKLTSWSEPQALYLCKNSLKGAAKKALENSLELNDENDYKKFMENLKVYFTRKKTVSDLSAKFYGITHTPGMRIRELADTIQRAGTEYLGGHDNNTPVDPVILDRIILSKFLSTVRADLSLELRKAMPKSFKEAINKAEQLVEILGEDTLQVNSISEADHAHMSLIAQIQNLEHKISTLTAEKPQEEVKKQDLNCLACGSSQHLLIDCPTYIEFTHASQNQPRDSNSGQPGRPYHPYSAGGSNRSYSYSRPHNSYYYSDNYEPYYQNRGRNTRRRGRNSGYSNYNKRNLN